MVKIVFSASYLVSWASERTEFHFRLKFNTKVRCVREVSRGGGSGIRFTRSMTCVIERSIAGIPEELRMVVE